MQASGDGLGIGEVVERTGVAEATLRMWGRRHGFPAPQRLASGHRGYSEREIELIRPVAAKRAAGLALPVAIEQAQSEGSKPATSVFTTLRRRRPDLEPRVLLKPMMLALSQAIEDEALARAERLMVLDRKSTRLNSSHPSISYAVFCWKKKKKRGATSAAGTRRRRRTRSGGRTRRGGRFGARCEAGCGRGSPCRPAAPSAASAGGRARG